MDARKQALEVLKASPVFSGLVDQAVEAATRPNFASRRQALLEAQERVELMADVTELAMQYLVDYASTMLEEAVMRRLAA